MCCAQTAAPEGRIKSAGKRKSVVTALIKALRNEVRGAEKGMPKHSPGAFQNLAQHVPDPSKIEAWGVPGNQNEPKKSARPTKSAQETPQEPPRGSPKRPGAPQERPRAVQEAHGRRPNPSKIGPGAFQDPPKIHLKSRSQKTCIFSSILVRFF